MSQDMLEVTVGFEPTNNTFAECPLNHLSMLPSTLILYNKSLIISTMNAKVTLREPRQRFILCRSIAT